MDSLQIDDVIYWLPANEGEVISLVNDAKAHNEVICLRGAAHSFPIIGLLEKGRTGKGKPYKYVMLSKMFAVTFLPNDMVSVQAGCHLGPDPWDPTGYSTSDNSLLVQLDNANLSLPDLGGITHQTVGGFLSTSSSGGSTQYSFDDAIMSIDIICCGANGAEKKTFTRPADGNPDDPFFGAGVATMGLFGIIVAATFKCSPRFYIKGQEAITYADDCEIDLFGKGSNGKPDVATYFKTTEYSRFFWWPQVMQTIPTKIVGKIVVWKAKQTDFAGAKAWALQAYEKTNPGQKSYPSLKPYEEVPYIMGSPTPATLGADILFTAIGTWPAWLLNLLGDTLEYQAAKATVEALFYSTILPKILDIFVAIDTPDNVNKGPQQFADRWYLGLPMDNQMSDKLMPIWFTELWIDIDDATNVMNDMRDYYNASTDNTGAFNCEIYATKKSPFWLSPAYNCDVVRIDVLWFANNTGDPAAFYQGFWNLLAKYKYRPHWGKYIPDTVTPVVEPPAVSAPIAGPAYLKSCYPKWDAWMALRAEMDPNQVFLNDYWRAKLDIANVTG